MPMTVSFGTMELNGPCGLANNPSRCSLAALAAGTRASQSSVIRQRPSPNSARRLNDRSTTHDQ